MQRLRRSHKGINVNTYRTYVVVLAKASSPYVQTLIFFLVAIIQKDTQKC